ncbi:YkgJ family cysteine cluster protein [Solimonas soli]|uniref:YkgJ family cysteine cluster protein n=1 Tax=Solimonas soli TaxID=413479 RepID=UPI000483F61C|nr:YkgJ family cysteine cluster protein [Solimonas soli]
MSAARDIHFRCSACGACCDSPPAMSLPELFEHEDSFVGCIAIHGGGDTLALRTQGLERGDAGCPALDADRRCGIHTRRPAMCQAVPLDPTRPDAGQAALLEARRRQAPYAMAGCITTQATPGSRAMLIGGALVDDGDRRALARYREETARDRALWGEALRAELRRELAGQPPLGGYRTIPLVPALATLAAASASCRQRVLRYLDRQRALIARTPAAARPAELQVYARVYQRLALALQSARPAPPSPHAGAIEAHLRLAAAA